MLLLFALPGSGFNLYFRNSKPAKALLDWRLCKKGILWGLLLLLVGGASLSAGCKSSGSGKINLNKIGLLKPGVYSPADVKMEIPVLVQSLKSSILSSTSFQMGKTFWGVVSAAVEQSRSKANMVAQEDGKFDPSF